MKVHHHASMGADEECRVKDRPESGFTVLEFGAWTVGREVSEQSLSIHVNGTPDQREAFLRALGQQLLDQAGTMRREVAARQALLLVR